MKSNEIGIGLAQLLAARASEDYDLESDEPSVLVDFLVDMCELAPETAEALVWGLGAQPTSEELDCLSNVLTLHRDLLAAVIVPTSEEMLEHILKKVAEESLDPGCPECEDFAQGIACYRDLDADEQAELCLEVLDHLNAACEEPIPDYGPEPAGQPSRTALEENLAKVFASLDDQARMRVLAYAYQELADSLRDPRPQRISAYGHLRRRYLSPLALRVMDRLAASDDGALTAAELVDALDLGNGRALGQVPRSVQRAVRDLRADGHRLEEEPLQVERRGRATIFRLTPQALETWRELLRAEGSPQLG